jgi:UDP-2-acetamido-2,6-beta-L-arabino-hexul-4-ose reductase
MSPEADEHSPPRKIAVTGAAGFLGWHLRCRARVQKDVELRPIDRTTFASDAGLEDAIRDADAVIHLAGQNRGDPADVYQTNVALADRLAQALHRCDSSAHVVFSSSTHIDGPSEYGRSKRDAASRLEQWASGGRGSFCHAVLPHLFGEHGRPFYNSATATFAYQLAHQQTPKIDRDSTLHLLHAGDAAESLLRIAKERDERPFRPAGTARLVSEVVAQLSDMDAAYRRGIIPVRATRFDQQLFNQYRSYLPADARPISLQVHHDPRGWLFESIRHEGCGQSFVSSTQPGITRGEHFHFIKLERFVVVEGNAIIRLRRVGTNDLISYPVSGRQPQAIDIPTLHTHNITNVGDGPLITLFWSDAFFDPAAPDTYPMKVADLEPQAELLQGASS